ncbi:MAG TPA: FAD-dependent oxidoreductase [Allocoleopsis sp.]
MSQKLILIGGGHSHAIALKSLAFPPLSNVDITLISETSHTPYSGMLPGHIAGYYTYDQTHINLPKLTEFAQVQLLIDKVINLDLLNHQVICQNSPPISFDLLSINIGSTPNINSILNAEKYSIPVKPVYKFLKSWQEILTSNQNQIKIGIIGGGAGGVELALSMKKALEEKIQINLVHQGQELLPNHNQWVRNSLHKRLIYTGINLYLGEKVIEIEPNIIKCESGLKLESDYIFMVTKASAPTWIKTSGLTTDENGFILVTNTLQSCSHSHIFAAGDIATIRNYPRPKSGVFAVKQGQPLYDNLRAYLLGEKLTNYLPQNRFLNLISMGEKRAIASWGEWGWEGELLWYIKDYIDRQFMAQFP